MGFSITILGCSSAIPTVDRNPSGQVINFKDRLYLIDCAEGTQLQLRRYMSRIQRLQAIFISHLHGDHFFGLVGLISTLNLLGRKKELHVYGPEGLEEIVMLQLTYSQTQLMYPLFFHKTTPGVSEVICEEDDFEVLAFPLDHRIPTHGFVFREKRVLPKIRKEVVFSEAIPYTEYQRIKEGDDYIMEDGTILPHESLTIPAAPPRSYAYCSDTRYTETIIPFIKDVDLLYHETTFLKDLTEQADLKFHSTAEQAATIAKLADVKKLLIGHYSARYDEPEKLLDEALQVFKETYLSYDGLTINIEKEKPVNA
jgi:ribonuclease Z